MQGNHCSQIDEYEDDTKGGEQREEGYSLPRMTKVKHKYVN